MTVRLITSWNGLQPGDTYAYAEEGDTAEADLVAGGVARDVTENDNAGSVDLQSQITALVGKLPVVLGDFASDELAAAGGVAVGALYHTTGAVKIRLA